MARLALRYLEFSLLVLIFGAIYEHFSFGVTSNYMVYAFVFPLAGGAIPALALSLSRRRLFPGWLPLSVFHSAIATWTVGSLLQGALAIYGTTNRLIGVYWTVGAALFAASWILYCWGAKRHWTV